MKQILFSFTALALLSVPLLSLAQGNDTASPTMMEGGAMMDEEMMAQMGGMVNGDSVDGMDGMMPMMMNMMSMMDKCPMMANSLVWQGFGLLFGVLLLVLMALGIVVLVKQLTSHRVDGGDRAQSILKERYARGEVEAEEFESKKKDL